MDHLTDRDLLSVWEAGSRQSTVEKSLWLLTKAFPHLSFDQVAGLSIGDRDARLLQIREQLFGKVLKNAAVCPHCQNPVEWETSISDLKLQPIREDPAEKTLDLRFNGQTIHFRLPNTLDVLEVMSLTSPAMQADALIRTCTLQSTLPFERVEDYPDELKSAILHQMETNDPQADIVMDICCPACAHTWSMLFDIMEYLWKEIDEWARQLLQDVYLLARTFGWSEREILDMSRFRRNLYIEMIIG